MPLAENGGGRDAAQPRLLYRHLHGALGDGVSEAPVAVDDRGGCRLLDDLEWGTGDDVPALHPVDVRGNLDDAVGVVPRQVGPDGVLGHHSGLVAGRAGGVEERRGDLSESVRWYVWHLVLLKCGPSRT